jgi:hypothetical protein
MPAVATIYAGEGAQAVEVYAVDARGRPARPSSATVRIVDLDLHEGDPGRVILAETAATVDGVSTVLTAGAGPAESDPRRIAVTSAVGVVPGRRYAVSGSGRLEAITVDRVAGLDVYAAAPLYAGFAVSSTLVGLRVEATFPGGVADDPARLTDARAVFGVDWTFAGVSGPVAVRTLARIERRGTLPRATVEDVLRIDPQVQQVQHARGTLADQLAQADRELDARLLHAGHSLADTSHGEIAAIAVAWRALELVYRSLGEEHVRRAEGAAREAKAWTALVLGGRRPDDAVATSRATDRRRGRRLL